VNVFGAGLAIGFFLIGVACLPFLVGDPLESAVAAPAETDKSRGVTLISPSTKTPSAAADTDEFIEGEYWALIIGVNKYSQMDKDKQLDAARKDAEAVAKLLVARYGFSRERMIELYDEQGTRRGIIRAFNNLKRRLKDNDSLFIYYAGHGEYEESKDKEKQKRVDGMGYWIPSDAEPDDPSSYIFNSQVRDYLANIDARHIFAVVDSCFSGSLMGKSRVLGPGAIKELYQSRSRWILASGGFYPVPDVVDKNKGGHSTFAWHFMRFLERNTSPYVLARDIADAVAERVSNEVKDQLPRGSAVVGAGDDNGQFVFRLRKEFRKAPVDTAALEAERAKVAAAQGELSSVEEQLKKAEEALKRQMEEIAARKQAMLERVRQTQEAKRKAEEEERLLAASVREAEERANREAEERQARLKAEEGRSRQAEAERLAAAKKFEQEQREREQMARDAELARRKLEEERKAEAERLAALRREAEARKEEGRLAELKMQQGEQERKRLAELKQQEEERRRLEAEMQAAKAREEKRLAELKRTREEEERRLAKERRRAEEERLAEGKAQAEKERLAELKRKHEEGAARKAEEERLAALAREAEEQQRKLAEAKKKAEEEQKNLLARQLVVEEQMQKATDAQKAEGAPAKPAVIEEATLRPFQAPKAKDLAPVVLVPAGPFIMGSNPGEGVPDEAPQRKVHLDAFTIDKYEVTVAQYADFLKKSGSELPDYWDRANQKEDANRPVVGVDWLEASEYCAFYGKRLPTEAQWEKAARGDDGRPYPWGNENPGPLFANFASGTMFTYGESLSPVGSYEAGKSPYGVYDMVGNVWEWALDWYSEEYYKTASLNNPTGPASGDFKVTRGGSWTRRIAVARVAGRGRMLPSQRSNFLGFRCAGEAP